VFEIVATDAALLAGQLCKHRVITVPQIASMVLQDPASLYI